MGQGEANDVAIEAYSHVQVSDGEVHFRQIARVNHQLACTEPLLHKTSLTSETLRSARPRRGWNKETTLQVIE
jgi:hypothetical protein